MRFVFGDGTSQACWAGVPVSVLVGTSLTRGREQDLTPEEVRELIAPVPPPHSQPFVRMLRQTARGNSVPRVIQAVED